MSEPQPQDMRIRLGALRALAALVFVTLVVQLWRLQVLQGETYQAAADVNRLRLEAEPAPRGVIYDHRGRLLARNMPEVTVSIVPAYLPEDEQERKALLIKLANLIEMPVVSRPPNSPIRPAPESDANPQVGILDLLKEAEKAPYRPAPVKSGTSREVALILEEEHLDWPGVLVQVKPVREYLQGPLTAHILGYVGPIPEAFAEEYQAQGYDPNRNQVGLAGLEYTFEEALRGQDGQ